MDWDALRTFEAITRTGSLTHAARALGVSQSTVSRHLSRLESEAGTPLILRTSPVTPTVRGEALRDALGPMMTGALAAEVALNQPFEVAGQVTLSTVGEVTRWTLIDALPVLYNAHPQLRLRILADNQVVSLTAGEADLALRVRRPVRGELVTRRVFTESFGFFAAASLRPCSDAPWLGLSGSLAEIPEARHAERSFPDRPARLLLDDVEALGIAVRRGLGVAILPRRYARGLAGVHEVRAVDFGGVDMGSVPSLNLWLVVHRSKQRLPPVRAVMDWLVEALGQR